MIMYLLEKIARLSL